MDFRNLHQQDRPLLLANVWDVSSARVAVGLSFQAIGTSSAAIASMLGYADGEGMPFSVLYQLVERIGAAVDLPLSVDLEEGYSRDTAVIIKQIKSLAKCGVVGINLEDSLVEADRDLVDANAFAKTIHEIKNGLVKDGIDIFLNVRTDTFLLGGNQARQETLKRVELYQAAGADGIFIPGLIDKQSIQEIVASTDLPLNIMAFPGLPSFEILKSLGVKRISMGNFLYDYLAKSLQNKWKMILDQGSFNSLF